MHWIADTFTSNTGWSHLQALVDTAPRMAGSDGERHGAELTRDALAEVGARDAHLHTFDIQGWTRGDSHIEAGDTTQDCIALPRSPSASAAGPLVDVGHGMPDDFERADCEGAVVMASSDTPDWCDRRVHRREKYYSAVDAGAVAFVFRNHVEGCLPPTGSVGSDHEPVGPVPAVGVSREVGRRLGRRLAGARVTVGVEADTHEATSQTVHADLGPDTDEAVLLTSHVDAHDISEGAMDNGAGTATVVEVARALSAREAALDTRVHVACFGAEEVGLQGSSRLADRLDDESVKAVCNLDGVVRGRDIAAKTHGFDALGTAVETVSDRFDHPITVDPRMGPHSDHWPFVARGIPGVWLTSDAGPGRGWGHTHADTIDKLDSRTLRETAILATELVVELADTDRPVPHTDTDEVAAALEAQGFAEGMRATGDWPY